MGAIGYTDSQHYGDIASAIRGKNGQSTTYLPSEMAAAITAIPTGGGTLQQKSVSYTPSETAQSETVRPDSGYDGLSQVSVSVGAVSSTYVGSEITRRSSTDLTASGATVTAPAGYYSEQATKSVTTSTLPTSASSTRSYTNKATIGRSTSAQYINIAEGYQTGGSYTISAVADGTAGTPTASKGSVSNHSISVTPSVTNSTGWITGGTKTGTAVTVSASELVSGSQTITGNGTVNVTNLASVEVAVPFVTYRTGTTNPSSSLGSDGDIYLKVVS